MARTPLTKAKKTILLVLALMAFISSVVVSIAVFTDRVNSTTTIQMATFDDDGYSIARTAPEGYVTAGETLEVTLKESNDKSENITSQITMTVSWDSPVPNVYPWGNSSAGNAVINLGDTVIPYTVNADKTITFTLPETALKAGSDVTSKLTFQIPADLPSTGKLNFNFDQIELGYASWTTNYDDTKLDALDFSVDVAWNISKNPTTATGKSNLDVIAILKDSDKDGKYELEIIKNGSNDNTNKGQMMDWTGEDQTPWTNYPIEKLTIDDGVTTIGDYAFAGETGITSVDIPNTITHIGTSAFDGSGLTGELVIPASVKEIESLGFGNLPGVKVITFEHGADDTLKLPDNESAGKEKTGAFYVPTYVSTTINTNNKDIEYEYRWHNDNRKPIPTLAAQDTWYKGTTAKNTITSITILDYYEPSSALAEPAWDASAAKDGSVKAYVESDGSGGYKLTIAGNGYGLIYANADSTYAFGAADSASAKAFSKATAITGLDLLDTSNTTNMKGMFKGCSSVTALDVSTFDTQKVTNMNSTFCDCAKVTALDVSRFDMQDVTDTSSMFYNCATLTTLDVDGFDTRNVTDMSFMFAYCEKLTSLNVGLFDTQKVTTTESMFEGCYVLTTLDVKKESVTLNGRTFTAWDTGAVTTMASMFAYCNELGAMDLSNWDATSVETMFQMFYNCYAMPSVNLTNFSTSSALKNMGSTFYQCQSLPTVDLSSFTTTGLEDMSATFFSCYDLTGVTFGNNFDASAVQTIRAMFSYCSSLVEFDFTDFNTSSALTNMYMLFANCTNLKGVDFTNFNTSGVTNMASAFYKCSNLLELDLSMFNTAKVTTTAQMFAECPVLRTIYVSYAWSNASNTYSVSMFSNNYDLVGGAGTPYSSNYIDVTRALIDGMDGKRGYFTNNIFLSYDDVKAGETVDPDLTIKSTVFDDYTSKRYEVVSGGEYASVNASTGVVTGKAKGTATVQVTLGAANGDIISTQAEVNVLAAKITNATLTYEDVYVGDTVDPGLTITPSNYGEYKSIKYEVISGGEYAEVDETSGVVTGLAPGTAIIQVTIVDMYGNTVTAQSTVNVLPIGITKATLRYDDVKVGETVDPDLTIEPSNHSPYKSKTYAIISGSNFATIDPSTGKVTGVSGGTVTVQVTIVDANGKTVTAQASLRVIPPKPILEERITWYTQGGTSISNSSITSIEVVDSYFPTTYVEKWDASDDKAGTVTAYLEDDGLGTNTYKLTIAGNGYGCVYANPISHSALSGMYNATKIDVTLLNTSDVVDMEYMFSGNSGVTKITGLETWDTSNVLNFYWTFGGCSNLTDISNINNWDVSSAGTFSHMFYRCMALTTLDLSGWDIYDGAFTHQNPFYPLDSSYTSNGVAMDEMFSWCQSMEYLGDITQWNMTNVTTTYSMFNRCGKLISLAGTGNTTTNLSSWADKVTNLTNTEQMFQHCYVLGNVTGISTWKTNSLTSCAGMFYDCYALTSMDVSGWNTTKLTTASSMFYGCTALKEIDISGWQIGSTVTASSMLSQTAITELTLGGGWSHIPDSTFIRCQVLTKVYFTHTASQSLTFGTECFLLWDPYNENNILVTTKTANNTTIQSIVDAYDWIGDYRAKKDAPILAAGENWYTQGGTSVAKSSITSIAFSDSTAPSSFAQKWDASDGKVGTVYAYLTDAGSSTYKLTIVGNGYGCIKANYDSEKAFYNFSALTSFSNINLLDTCNTKYMNSMFSFCQKLTSLDISHFDTRNVTDFSSMFRYCIALNSLTLTSKSVTLDGVTYDSWDTKSALKMGSMFSELDVLTSLDVSHFDTQNVTTHSQMFYACESLATLNISTKSVTLNGRTFNSWDTGSSTKMNYMFFKCLKLTTLNLSHFDTADVETFSSMFHGSSKLATLKLRNGSVTLNGRTFTPWVTSSATDMHAMFSTCNALPSFDVTYFDTSKVTDFSSMFYGCLKFTTLNVSTFNTKSVTDAEGLEQFAHSCPALTSITLGTNFGQSGLLPDPGAITGMFYYRDTITTTVTGANSVMKAYKWSTDLRTVTFK